MTGSTGRSFTCSSGATTPSARSLRAHTGAGAVSGPGRSSGRRAPLCGDGHDGPVCPALGRVSATVSKNLTMGWRSLKSVPDPSRAPRQLPVGTHASCHFCGRYRNDVASMEARPVLRTWTDTGEQDEGETIVCDVCLAKAERSRSGRSCDLCEAPVGQRDFLGLGMAGTICHGCVGDIRRRPNNWAPRAGKCVNCGRDLRAGKSWASPLTARAICSRCLPPSVL